MMKTKLLSLAAIFTIALFSGSVKAQVTASATATATIVTPISITKTVDMNFGKVARGVSGGTVVLSPAGVRTPTGTVQLAATNTGTVTAAVFTVAGEGAYTYAITVPSGTHTITHTNATDTMTVNAFTATTTNTIAGTSPNYTSALVSGADTIRVGATLNVSGSQIAGVYASLTGFDVTVNYN